MIAMYQIIKSLGLTSDYLFKFVSTKNTTALKSLSFLPLCCFILSNAFAQNADEQKISKMAGEIMTNSQAYNNLKIFCKDIGPRLSGSANAAKAIKAGEKMMKDAGADKVYLQPCMVTHWERGAEEKGSVRISGKKYPLELTALGNSVPTPKAGIQAEIWEVKTMQELHALGNKVKGKIVFFNIPMNPTYIETFRAYGESGIGRRAGASQAAKYGAIGVMVRSLASNIDNHPHTGALVYNDSFPKIPAIAISTKNAEWLSTELSNAKPVTGFFTTNCKMFPDVLSYNVIGEITGSEHPEEVITVGGHLDSWDLAEGANDDGSGCVQSIEVLRAIRKNIGTPKRTIRAVLFMNEENGGGGGRAYADSAAAGNDKFIFALESDGGGFTPRAFGFDMPEYQFAKVEQWLSYFLPYGVYEFKRGGGGSDIAPLKKTGTSLAGLVPDSQRYFDIHHAETDVLENVSKRELDLGAVNMATLIWLISEYGLN